MPGGVLFVLDFGLFATGEVRREVVGLDVDGVALREGAHAEQRARLASFADALCSDELELVHRAVLAERFQKLLYTVGATVGNDAPHHVIKLEPRDFLEKSLELSGLPSHRAVWHCFEPQAERERHVFVPEGER